MSGTSDSLFGCGGCRLGPATLSGMAKVLVAEKIAESGLERLRAAGHEVEVQVGLSPEELAAVIPGAHALIIRSATTATRELIAAGSDLVVIGRAGVGLDNVDIDAATEHGVLVANAPTSNIVSAAEQTMALILASARNTPQAHSALTEGRWERSKWGGVELQSKTLGIIGLGQIGKLVATRAAAFAMKIVAYDPWVTDEGAASVDAEMMSLDDLVAAADFITIHVAKTPQTLGMIDAELLSRAKPNLRVVNVARGGIIVEADLADAVANGVIAGAALDVFENEPLSADSPLLAVPQIVLTPHLGASTAEAQTRAGDQIAEQVELALAGGHVPFAVNTDAIAGN